MPVLAELVGVEGLRQPAAHVVAERDRAEKRYPIAPLSLGHGEGRGHDAAAWMSQRRRMRVVGFIGVSEHAVGQRGIHGGGNDIAPNHAGFFDAAERFDVADRSHSGREARARNHGGERVEDVVFGLFDHRGRKQPA